MATHVMDDLAAHAFELVNKELASTLDAARAQLEDYVDGRAGAEALARTAEHLHVERGELKIVEIHGDALLAILGQTGGEHAAGRAGADHYVLELAIEFLVAVTHCRGP